MRLQFTRRNDDGVDFIIFHEQNNGIYIRLERSCNLQTRFYHPCVPGYNINIILGMLLKYIVFSFP